ncbi:hypothetical protein D3C81_1592160 [compost metagenome]
MGTEAVGEEGADILVVHRPGLGLPALVAVEVADVGLQLARAQCGLVDQAGEVLLVDLVQFGVVVAQGQGRGQVVVAAGKDEAVGLGPAVEAPVGCRHGKWLVVGGIAQVHAIQPAGMQGQVVHVLGA